MVWDNPPVRISERGAAIQPCYIYVNSLSKGFLVYNGVRSAQHTFFVKEYPGSTDTWIINVDIGIVDFFDIGESETNNNVIIAYSHNERMYRLEVDFLNRVVVSGPEFVFVGEFPAFDKQKPPKIDYIRKDNLRHRADISGSSREYEVGDSPDRLFLQIAADKYYGQNKMRFAAQMIPAQYIALPFSNIAGTILRYNGQTTLSGPRRLKDLSVNTYHLPIDVLPIHIDYGLLYDDSYTPQITWAVPSVAFTIEAWIYARLSSNFSYVMGGTDIEFSYKNNGILRFMFSNIDVHIFEQDVSDIIVQPDQLIHICISHTWESPDDTFLTINGTVVSAKWITTVGGSILSFIFVDPATTRVTTATSHGLSNNAYVRIKNTTSYNGIYSISNVTSTTFDIAFIHVGTDTGHWTARGGEEDPGFINVTSDIVLSKDDYLHSMRILNIARSSVQIRSYIDGKSL